MSQQQSTIASLIIDRSAKGLNTALTAVQKALSDMGTIAAHSEALAMQIEDKQLELAAIQAEVAHARRTADAELKLQVLEDARKVFDELTERLGFAKVTKGELEVMSQKLTHAQRDYSDEVAKIREDEQAKYHAATRSQIAVVENKHAVEIAQKDADLVAKTKEIGFLQSQLAYLQKQIDDERATRLQIAQAESSKQGVVVNAGK